MKKLLLIPVLFLMASCHSKKVDKVVIGKDMASDKYGTRSYYLYFNEGMETVTGSDYYLIKVGDTISVTELEFN